MTRKPMSGLTANNRRRNIRETHLQAEFLATLLHSLASSPTLSAFTRQAAAATVAVLGDWCAIWSRRPSSTDQGLLGVHHREVGKAPLVQNLTEDWLRDEDERIRRECLETRNPLVTAMNNQAQARRVFRSRERTMLARQLGVTSILVIPLVYRRRHIGTVAIGTQEPAAPFSESAVTLAGGMAPHLSAAFEQLRNLEMARTVSQQLTLSNLRLQTIFETIPQGILIAGSPDGNIITANVGLARLLGQPISTGTPLTDCPESFGLTRITGEPLRVDEVPWLCCVRTDRPTRFEEIVIHRPDGRKVTALCGAVPVKDVAGKTVGAVAVFQDITERLDFEHQRDEFLAMASHELKSPLATIRGFTQLLGREALKTPRRPLSESELEMLANIDRQVSRLNRLIGDLVDYSRIQTGRLNLRPKRFALTELAEVVVGQIRVTAPDRTILFREQGDTTVKADPGRIEQVLTNLIFNAVRATEEGSKIEVNVLRKGKAVLVSVHDNGVGIPEALKEHIFQPLRHQRNKAYEGMGLGLYISKGIIAASGGKIWFESEEGKGTTFAFELRSSHYIGRDRSLHPSKAICTAKFESAHGD